MKTSRRRNLRKCRFQEIIMDEVKKLMKKQCLNFFNGENGIKDHDYEKKCECQVYLRIHVKEKRDEE
jgi:hypothetical protein